MATATLNRHGFPEGTSVSAWPAQNSVNGGPPAGPSVATAAVTSGVLTFTGLTVGVRYIAYAAGRGVQFRADEALGSDTASPGSPERRRLDFAEAAIDVDTTLSARVELVESTTTVISEAMPNVMEERYGAVGDGSADDHAAITAALAENRYVKLPDPPSFYNVLSKIVVPDGAVIEGDGGASYWASDPAAPDDLTVVKKTNGDTNGNCVFEVGRDVVLRGLSIEAPSFPYYLASIYPTRPNNPSYGVFSTNGKGFEAHHVTVAGFKLAGIGGTGYEVPKLVDFLALLNLYGVDWTANDAHMERATCRHNVHTGYKGSGAADTFSDCRIEWNGRYGIQSAGRLVIGGGSRVDRNGWAGINMVSGAWGLIVGACEFFRNAAGGDSVFGRTAEVTTTATDPDGNVMYLAPATELDKCHIRAEGVKYVIIGGGFRAGADDAGGGARSPKYVYGLKDVGEFIISSQDRIGWQQNLPDLGSAAYREGAGSRVRAEGSVTLGGIEWQDAIALFPGVIYSPSYIQSAGGGAGTGAIVFGSSADVGLHRMAAGVIGIDKVLQFLNSQASGTAPNDSLFKDTATSKITYKDSTGGLQVLESAPVKLPVRVAAPVNVTVASPGATIDGVTMVAPDRVLLANQTTASQNGVYVWNGAAVAMTRATDSDTAAKLTDSLLVTVDEGAVNRDSIFSLSTNKPITLGVTSLRFTRVHPAYAVSSHPAGSAYQPTASKLENLDRTQVPLTNQAALATGTVRVFPLGVLRAGDTLAGLNFQIGTTGAATVTNSWAGIARLSDRAILAISPSSAAAPGADTLKTFTFNTPFTADKDETLVAFVMFQATTVPSLYGINHGGASVMAQAPVMNGTADTGKTTPMTVAAPLAAFTADTEEPYTFAT